MHLKTLEKGLKMKGEVANCLLENPAKFRMTFITPATAATRSSRSRSLKNWMKISLTRKQQIGMKKFNYNQINTCLRCIS